MVEAARIFAADGGIAELGALVSWDAGRETRLLPGEMPAEHDGRPPLEVMTELGVVERLFAEHPGQLEWHSPWHATHTADAMLRGRVDPLAVDAWLAAQGVGWLTLKDNGAYGLIAVQGAGWIGKHRLQTPAMIRFGELTEDEVFVTHEAARAGVMFENTGGEPLVTLRYFGPDTNPQAPNAGDYRR